MCVLHCVAVCSSMVQCFAVCCRALFVDSKYSISCNSAPSKQLSVGICVAGCWACCSVLQRVAACCSVSSVLQRVAACCSVLQRVAARCSVLQRVAWRCDVDSRYRITYKSAPRASSRAYICVLQRVAVCCSVLQCVAVCCSAGSKWVLPASQRPGRAAEGTYVYCSASQCVAVCCSVLQCVAVQAVNECYLQISAEGEQPIVAPELPELILKI